MTISIRQVCSAWGGPTTSQSSIAGMFTAATLAGSTIYVITTCNTPKTITSFVDASNGNYGGYVDQLTDSASDAGTLFQTFSIDNARAISTSQLLTLTISAATSNVGFIAFEITGTNPLLVAHGSNLQNPFTSTTANAITSGAVAGGTNPALVLGISANTTQNNGSPYVGTVGTGYTLEASYFPNAVANTLTVETLNSTSPGSIAATFTLPTGSTGSPGYAQFVAVFAETAYTLTAAEIAFTLTLEAITFNQNSFVFPCASISYTYTPGSVAFNPNTSILFAAPISFDLVLAIESSNYGLDATVVAFAETLQNVTFPLAPTNAVLAAATVSFTTTIQNDAWNLAGSPQFSFNATFWSWAAMGPYVIAIPYTTSSAYTGPYIWANQGILFTQFIRPVGAPGCRVGATVGQFLMLGDLFQQQQPVVATGDGATLEFQTSVVGPMNDAGSIFDQKGVLAGTFDNGTILSSGILGAGFINYVTGALDLRFSSAAPNGDQIFAQYTQVAPYRVAWSAIGDPTNWPTPLTDAAIAAQSSYEDLEVDLGPVMFIAGYPLYGLIFQRFGITRATYQGGQVVFAFATYERKRGCIAHGAAVQVASYVYFLADDGFYVTDGANVTPIGTASDNSAGIDNWFWANVNPLFLESIRAGYDAVKRSIFFAIPTGANVLPDTLLTYNLLSGRWTRALVSSETIWTADNGTDANAGNRQTLGVIDQLHEPNNLNGQPLTGYLETCDIFFIDGQRRLTTGARAHVNSTDLPLITVGNRDALQDPVTYSAGAYPDNFSKIAPFLAGGIYTRVRVGSTNASALHSATLLIEQEGNV